MTRFGMALLFVVCACGPAAAWGDFGHRVVCEIAFRLALPEARAEVRRLMKDDPQYDFFRDACIFPDHPRKRPSEHFVNLARTSTGLTSSACPVAGKCVLSAIDADSVALAADTDDAKKLEALKFLGHWVGDLHQPLHVSFEDDRGGNSITVSGACTGNLHSAWDTCLAIKAVGTDPAVAATDLLKDISPTVQEQWTQALDPKDWANESFRITRSAAAHYCVQQAGSCNLPLGIIEIDDAFIQASSPLIRVQLSKAGVRLAYLLNKALGK